MSEFQIQQTLPESVQKYRPGKRSRYGPFFDAVVAANGAWVAIPASEVAGPAHFPSGKIQALKAGAAWRSLDVEIARDEETLWVKLRVPVVENQPPIS